MSSGSLPGGFQSARALFRDDAPLAHIDRALADDPRVALEDLFERIEQLDDSPATALVTELRRASWQEIPRENLPALRDLAAAVLAESWLAPPEDLVALELTTALGLLSLPLPRAPFHGHLAEALRRHPPVAVAEGLEVRFDEVMDGPLDAPLRLLEAAGDLASPEVLPFLIGAMGDDCVEELCEAAADALSRIGEPGALALIERWDQLQSSMRCYAFAVFERVADEHVQRFLVERGDELLEDDPPLFAWAASCVPDSRLAAKLASRLADAGGDEIEAFYIICRLLGESPPELEAVASRLARNRAAESEIPDLLDRWEEERFLWLLLRCPECGTVAEYRAQRIFVDPERDEADPYVADEIPCRSCGALTDLELTRDARERILGAVLRDMAASAGGDGDSFGDELEVDDEVAFEIDDELEVDDEDADGADDDEDDSGPIIYASARLFDGRLVAMSEAVALYQGRLAEDPADVESLLSLANSYQTAERPASAERLYRRALELDPGLVEASWSLALSLLERGRPRDAFATLREAVHHLSCWRFLRLSGGTPATFRGEVGELYNELRAFLGATDAPEAPASLFAFRGRKVGRNEPCPCGSGRKYKKCCGAPA
jgi:tetratricopeptide (TPR) repeat protein